jgi:hypothetical protein
MIQKSEDYLTADTPLAAYLVTEGFNLIEITYDIKPNGRKRATYHFSNNDARLNQCVDLFNRSQATINLVLYEHAKASLLDRVMRGLP